jgi:cytochrome P450
VALEPIELAGHRIPEGQTVAICLGAANRDPSQFTDPDRLDLRRDNSHLAFGHGIHYCLGSALAKLEGEVAFSALLERYPEMRLSGGPIEWQENFTLRGVKSLRVAVR